MSTPDRLLCPTSGQECSYRAHLEELFTTVELDYLPPGFNPTSDANKLAARLLEHSTAARVLRCAGPDADNSCPTAEFMANNCPRTASKTVAKKVISLFRGTK